MKKIIIFLVCLFTIQFSMAQSAGEVLSANNQNLRDRFALMKTKAQTYQDYKVIKETVLDGVWKIVQDSLKTKDAALRAVKGDVSKLNEELKQINIKLKEKEQSMADVVHASTHINALGISFEKGSFLTLIVIIIGVLLALLALIAGRMKLMQSNMKQKSDLFEDISKEYEDYKRKALDKQTKLSRELQDERNKLHR